MNLLFAARLPLWLDLAFRERFFVILTIGIGVLVLIVLFFVLYVTVLRIRHSRKAETWNRLEEKWEPLLLAVLVGEQPPEELWRAVERGEELFFVDYLLRFARRVRGEERQTLSQLARPYLEPISARIKTGDPERRARAVQTLGELGVGTYADVVVAALDDSVPLVRMIAARALTREEHAEFVPDVIAKLHQFTEWSPNFLASLLSSAGPQAAPALRTTFADTTAPPLVRAIIGTGLGYLNDVESADVAASILDDETNTELVASALRLLARVGQPAHVGAIHKHLKSSNFVVRAAAATALGAVGDAGDREKLFEAYEDESRWVAIHAARALRAAGEIEKLRELAASRHSRASLALQVLTESGI